MTEKFTFNSKGHVQMLCTAGLSDEAKKYAEYIAERFAKDQMRLCVIYTPDCGCDVEVDFVLDRYPMSKKIISECPTCKKGCLMEISDPIRFYFKLYEKEISLDQLKDYVSMPDHEQYEFIKAYQNNK